jgi:hypothetical protein
MSAISATMITAAMATMATVDVARITRASYPTRCLEKPSRLGASRLCWAHRCTAVFVDLNNEPSRVGAAREPAQTSRTTEDDCVRIGPGLDLETLSDLLVKEDVESLFSCPHRVDVAGHSVTSIDRPERMQSTQPAQCSGITP